MQIQLTKGNNRNRLNCTREDGSTTGSMLGPDIPYHDIAHFVVEKQFELKEGFFGKIKSGMTIAALSDPIVIKTLGPESWLAEILARNLQAMGSKAASPQEYLELVAWETQQMEDVKLPSMSLPDIETMVRDFDRICAQWDALKENESLLLLFG